MRSEALIKKESDFTRILNIGIERFKPKILLVGFTGGSDSLTILHLMIKSGLPFRPFFCNTGIGIKEQWQFVRDYSSKMGLELIEQTPVYKTYKQMILANGFPGASSHIFMYSNLKEKSMKYINDAFDKDAMFITGVRISESERRKINISSEVQYHPKQGIKWCNPIMNWDDDDKEEFLDINGIERSPVSELIGFSGECLCGAYAKPKELEKIKMYFPETAEEIESLEKTLKQIGFTWGWNDQPPKGTEYDRIMEEIFPGFGLLKQLKRQKKEGLISPLCYKCEHNYNLECMRAAV